MTTDPTVPYGEGAAPDAFHLCIGCRAATGVRRTMSDQFPSGSPPPGMGWERFDCARCGVHDVRLVNVVPSGGHIEAASTKENQ